MIKICLREKKHSIIAKLKALIKKMIKFRKYLPLGKFVTEVLIFRSSRSQMFFKIGVLKNFAIFTGKNLC